MADDKNQKDSFEKQFIDQEDLDLTSIGGRKFEKSFMAVEEQEEESASDEKTETDESQEVSLKAKNRRKKRKAHLSPEQHQRTGKTRNGDAYEVDEFGEDGGIHLRTGKRSTITERKILSLRDLLYIFFKHLRAIIIITLVAIILSSLFAFTTTPLYTSDIKLLVQIGREKFAELEETNKNVNYSVLFQERRQNINNEIQIFKEDNLTRRIYPDLKEWLKARGAFSGLQIKNALSSLKEQLKILIGQKPLTFDESLMIKIKNSLRVEFLPESDILRLSFTWKDPEFAAVAVKIYASEFLKARAEVFQAQKSYRFYKEQIALYQQKFNEVTSTLKKFSAKWDLTNIELEKELVLKSKDELETRKNEHKNKIKKLSVYLTELKRMYDDPESWIETPQLSEFEMIDKQAYLQDIDRQFFTLKLEKDQMLASFTHKSREIRDLKRNIQNLKKRKYLSLKNILEGRVNALKEVGDTITAEILEKKKRISILNQAEFIYSELKLRKKVAQENLLMYTSKAESLRIYDDRDKRLISSIKIMNDPLPPLLPSYPKKMLIIITSGFLGLFISFGFAAVSEFFSHVFRDERDVEVILGLPLLMSIRKIASVAPKVDAHTKRDGKRGDK